MVNNVVLFVAEVLALISCVGGIAAIAPDASTYLALFYLGGWFFLGACCNVAGLWSMILFYRDDESDLSRAHAWLNGHFHLCWFTIVLGYPTLVTSFCLTYYHSPVAHAFCILGLLPFIAWLCDLPEWVPFLTKACVFCLIALQMLVCIAAKNWFGLAGACVMTANIVTLTIPTSHTTYFNISPREIFISGVALASLLFAQAVRQMYADSFPIKT